MKHETNITIIELVNPEEDSLSFKTKNVNLYRMVKIINHLIENYDPEYKLEKLLCQFLTGEEPDKALTLDSKLYIKMDMSKDGVKLLDHSGNLENIIFLLNDLSKDIKFETRGIMANELVYILAEAHLKLIKNVQGETNE